MTLTSDKALPLASAGHPEGTRLVQLEAARGIASVIVVGHHFTSAFWPKLQLDGSMGGLRNTPAFLLLNGSAAVLFFFMLSGFVLSLGFLRQPAPAMTRLAGAVLKRLPRLAIPAGASLLSGLAVLIWLGPARQEAASLTDSPWLAHFGHAQSLNLTPSLADAVASIPLVFLMPGHDHYNSSLWTMYYEFWGSMMVFALLHVILSAGNRVTLLSRHIGLALVGLAMLARVPLFSAFVFGLLLASLHQSRPDLLRFGRLGRVTLILTMVLTGIGGDARLLNLSALAAMLLLLQAGWDTGPLSGKIGRWLGKLSFPLYLVHVPVILSISSLVFVALHDLGTGTPVALALTYGVTLAASLTLSLPFVWLEAWWLPRLNRLMRRPGLA